MKTIYNVYVPMESQEQCNRMKQLCLDNGLPIWYNIFAFEILTNDKEPVFCYNRGDFYIYDFKDYEYDDIELLFSKATEQEFIELLQNERNT